MDSWTTVKWTEARQIVDAMEMDAAGRPASGVDPKSYYQKLRDNGDLDQAVSYLGHALPRFEAVAWAAYVLQTRAAQKKLPPADRQALDRVLRWLEEPTDEFRRAAFAASEAATRSSPESLLGLAVFMSGGSLGPPEFPAVNPPTEVCGRVAAAAIVIAAHQSGDPKQAMLAALDAGEKVAAKGIQALASR